MTYLFDTFVQDIQRTLNGYGLTQDRMGLTAQPVGISDTQIFLQDATGFEQGLAEIESETIWIQSVDRASNVLTLSPDGRGFDGSTAAAHPTIGTRLTMSPTFPKLTVANAINEAINAVYPTLFALATTQFTWSPVQTTYQMPTGAVRVLRVMAQTIGPSLEWTHLRRWDFKPMGAAFGGAPEIVIEQGAFPGRPIQVLYATQPTNVTWGQNFETSGLNASAKEAVRFHAASSLVSSMDVARLNVGSAQALGYDVNRNPIGMASKLSAQLYQRYELELKEEQRRLRLMYGGDHTNFRIR